MIGNSDLFKYEIGKRDEDKKKRVVVVRSRKGLKM